SNGEADEVRVLEFHARTFVAVVENHFDTLVRQLRVELLGQRHRLAIRRDGERSDADLKWRDGQRPNNPVLVIALLDDGVKSARYADAVSSHDARLALARLVEHGGVERRAVFRSELEKMAHFNGASNLQRFAGRNA